MYFLYYLEDDMKFSLQGFLSSSWKCRFFSDFFTWALVNLEMTLLLSGFQFSISMELFFEYVNAKLYSWNTSLIYSVGLESHPKGRRLKEYSSARYWKHLFKCVYSMFYCLYTVMYSWEIITKVLSNSWSTYEIKSLHFSRKKKWDLCWFSLYFSRSVQVFTI